MNEPDWSVWKPTERGVLCFIIRDGRILLIRKKRGLGVGKINQKVVMLLDVDKVLSIGEVALVDQVTDPT